MSEKITNANSKMNATIDIAKFIMAILVVGIHTEPFGFNVWLDRGFGILTRFCVPFFFVASSYFFWCKGKGILSYVKRILILYFVWSLIYLPLNIPILSEMSAGEIFALIFWHGNNHSLWYLLASAIGLLITYGLVKLFKGNVKVVFAISVFALLAGCIISTYGPLTSKLLPCERISNAIGYRNGLFYAFPYMALGAVIADSISKKEKAISPYRMFCGLLISTALLVVESVIFTIYFDTHETILWMSMLPCSYFLFTFLSSLNITLNKNTALFFRKASTLIYVSHTLFIVAFRFLNTYTYFFVVLTCAFLLSYAVIFISEKKYFRWMKHLY